MIKECDKSGKVINPTKPAEKDQLKRDCLRHATRSNNLIDWKAYEIALYGKPLFSDVFGESSASSSSDSDYIFLYATLGTDPKEDLSQEICVSSLSSSKVEGTLPLLICSGEMSEFAEEVRREHYMYTDMLIFVQVCMTIDKNLNVFISSIGS